MKASEFNQLKSGFTRALYFAGLSDDNGDPLDYDPELSKEAEHKIDGIINQFILSVSGVAFLYTLPNQSFPEIGAGHLAGIGADLYYTITGHGVGFWDGDYELKDNRALADCIFINPDVLSHSHKNGCSMVSEYLTEKAQDVCNYLEAYIGDDDKVYLA